MRYAALNQGADELTLYGQFRQPANYLLPSTQSRSSDEQLYAVSLYIYSLKPPGTIQTSSQALAEERLRSFP
jgi:hypothetical protein